MTVAVTGAAGDVTAGGRQVLQHTRFTLAPGEHIRLAPPRVGMRSYLAARGGFAAEVVFGSASTYLPAGFGGHDGRALAAGDRLTTEEPAAPLPPDAETPALFRPRFSDHAFLRAMPSAEWRLLTAEGRALLLGSPRRAARQIDRMGIRLDGGGAVALRGAAAMDSVAVLPGVVQLPPGGDPVLLGADAQTTGGYPRILSVIACDRWQIGQVRPGQAVTFCLRTERAARACNEYRARALRPWLPDDWVYGPSEPQA